MHSDKVFGGKYLLMDSDFCQILPVVPKGNKASIVNIAISSSQIWDYCTIFNLTKNMRLEAGSSKKDVSKLKWFSQWLLDVSDGKINEPHNGVAKIKIPPNLLVLEHANPIEAMVREMYKVLKDNLGNNQYFNDRAILVPTIEIVGHINEYMCSLLSSEGHDYLSYDTVCPFIDDSDCCEHLYTIEILNSINSSRLPSHRFTLKVVTPIMLLKNIDQAGGLCNRIRLQTTKLGRNVIEAITLNSSHPNKKVLIHIKWT